MDDRYSMGTVLDTSAWGGLLSGTALITRSTDSCANIKTGGTKTYLRQDIVRSTPSPYSRAVDQLNAQGCVKIGVEKRKYQEYMPARCQGCGGSMMTREADHDVYCCPPKVVKPAVTPGGFAPPETCPTNCSPRWSTATGVGQWLCDCAPYRPLTPGFPLVLPPVPIPVLVPGQGQQVVHGYRPPWRPAPWMALAAGLFGGFVAATIWKRR